jgi:flagellar hook-length control protein FliK
LLPAVPAPPVPAQVPVRAASEQAEAPPGDVLALAATGPEPALLPAAPVPGATPLAAAAEAEAAGTGPAMASRPAEPGQGTRPAHLPAVSGSKASAEKAPVAEPAGSPEPLRTEGPTAAPESALEPEPEPEHRPVEAKAKDEAAAPLPAASETRRAPVLVEAAPPAWHLRPEAPGPVRPEPGVPAPAQPQAPAIAPQAVAGQVAVAISRASDESVELRLDPPELGRVQIHLSRHDGALQAMVLADRPETQDLLRRHAEVLARELGDAGYDSVSLDFAGGGAEPRPGESGARDWAQAIVPPAVVEPAALAADPLPPARPAVGLDVGLDVRL